MVPSPRHVPVPRHVLLVDDDVSFCRLTEIALEEAGIEATSAHSVDGALRALAELPEGSVELILLDVAMPERGGFELVDELREAGHDVPVIFVSSSDATRDKVRGLQLGGDDYVVKPVDTLELVARMEAVVRRRRALSPIAIGELRLDLAYRRATRAGHELALSPREFELLVAFARRPGDVLSRAHLLKEVWDLDFDPQTNVLDVHLGRLRRKLDRHGRPAIATERGAGYRLKLANLGAAPPAARAAAEGAELGGEPPA